MSASDSSAPSAYAVPRDYGFEFERPHLMRAYLEHRECFWTNDEVDLSTDVTDWEKLDAKEQRLLEFIFAFFRWADFFVKENIEVNFAREIKIPEAQLFYAFQSMIEDIHSLTYKDMLDTLVRDPERLEYLKKSVYDMPCMRAKAEWVREYQDASAHSLAMRVAAFAFMEMVFFSSAFAVVFHFKKRGVLPGVSQANWWIARDENFHGTFAAQVFKEIEGDKPTTASMRAMFERGVEIECAFLRDAMPDRLPGINADLQREYVEYCADRLLQMLGYDKVWNTKNPYEWMVKIGLTEKTNTFEAKAAQYERRPAQKRGADLLESVKKRARPDGGVALEEAEDF